MSYTFSLTGNSTLLTQDFNPPIELDTKCAYEIALLNLETYNSLQNITDYNNAFMIQTVEDNQAVNKIATIPPGTYELEDIEEEMHLALQRALNKPLIQTFSLKSNPNTMKIELKSTVPISFNVQNSLGSVLGFDATTPKFLNTSALFTNISDLPPQIYSVNIIRVHCNLASGSFINGQPEHSLHEFFPTVHPGFKLSLAPTNLIYLPMVNLPNISNITIKLLDQTNRLVNNNSEELSVRIHVKKQRNGP